MNDEKERNDRIDKLIRILTENGTRLNNVSLNTLLENEHCHNRFQTEEDYQKEQADWLETRKKKQT
ncbi:MAG: hypothetical protein KKD44_12215 [Proteobacteria bacterium]|nr:hypothetical protein [Pseudomonadota bacterium]